MIAAANLCKIAHLRGRHFASKRGDTPLDLLSQRADVRKPPQNPSGGISAAGKLTPAHPTDLTPLLC
jgi:hypothetical protein